MAQGTRGRWMRVAATGFGVLLCTSLVGCMNSDKPKDLRKQGLPGTPSLSATNPGAANARTRMGTQQYGGPGANLQQGSPTSPAAGLGAGATRYGTSGTNSYNSGAQPTNFNTYGANPGQPGVIGSPTIPGQVPAGAGGPIGAAPASTSHSVAGAYNVDPLPPAPPGDLTYGAVTPPSTNSAPQQYSLSNGAYGGRQ